MSVHRRGIRFSLHQHRLVWALTVDSSTTSAVAISQFESPRAMTSNKHLKIARLGWSPVPAQAS